MDPAQNERRPSSTEAWPPPVPPLWRDGWAWASLLALVPLVLRSLGAPLGEPVADDFDHMHDALFGAHHGLLDGGGSGSFWRPLAYQGYFGLLTRVFLASRLPVVLIHLALLATATLLLHRTARRFVPGPWAAAIASFPLLVESARALIAVPVHIVDLGLIVCSALALHEAAAGRLWTSLAALAAAFGFKETAVATALLLPWLAPVAATGAGTAGTPGAAFRARRRWLLAAAAVTVVWAIAYAVVRARLGLQVPNGLDPDAVPPTLLERARWALVGTARAAFSQPLVASARDLPIAIALVAILIAAATCFARSARARGRFARTMPVAIAGLLWSAAATAPLAAVYPIWSPQRVVYSGIGLGVALVTLLGAAHPLLPAALVALRLTLFALAPAAPARVANDPPERGAFVDFERLARVQRFVAETRAALVAGHPTLPPGSRVGLFGPPLMTTYAFGRSRALQVWYRDTTLRMVRYDEMYRHPRQPLAAVVTYQEDARPQVLLLDPDSFHHYLLAGARVQREMWSEALDELARADSAGVDPRARSYRGRILGRRAFCFLGLGRAADAEREAQRSLAIWADVPDARYTLASVMGLDGRRKQAEAQLDTLLRAHPEERAAALLRDSLDAWSPAPR